MESSPHPKRYIKPTLQANWNLAISEVIRRLNAGLTYEAWLAIETLYALLPPEERPKIKHKYETIKRELDGHATDSVGYEEILTSFTNSHAVLNKHIRPFFIEMYDLLYNGGYLREDAGPTTKLRGLKSIEDALS